jgi:hypothetical protein
MDPDMFLSRPLPSFPAAGQQSIPEIMVLGAHRAAGTTTLASLLSPARDLGQADDVLSRLPEDARPLVLACRSSAWAAPRALAVAKMLASAGATPDILAIIPDGWPLSPEAAARFRQAGPFVGAMITFPFVRRPSALFLPRSMRQALADLRALAAAESSVSC